MRFTDSRQDGWPAPANDGRLRRLYLIVGLFLGMTGLAIPMTASAVTVGAVGDIVCDPGATNFNGGLGSSGVCRHKAVADLIKSDGVDAFLPLGDIQYRCGTHASWTTTGAYDTHFGPLLPITYPVAGNHEYYSDDPANGCDGLGTGYFDYFESHTGHLPEMMFDLTTDAAASTGTTPRPKGYYAYDLGSWRVITINTNENCKNVKCRGYGAENSFTYGSDQEQWLRDELAKNANRCVLAVMHYPRYSSNLAKAYTSTPDPNDSAVSGVVQDIWKDLYAGGAELVLSGHSHNYERFFPQDANNIRNDAFGVQQFVVGTGGNNLEKNATNTKNSAARIATTSGKYGYLRLELTTNQYSWVMRTVDGGSADAGTRPCHGAPVDLTSPANNTIATSTVQVNAKVAAVAATSFFDLFVDNVKVDFKAKVPTNCHTRTRNLRFEPIDGYYATPGTDKLAWWASPFCTVSFDLDPASLDGGRRSVRVETRDSNGLQTASKTIRLRVPKPGISIIPAGSTAFKVISHGSRRDPAYSHNLKKIAFVTSDGIVIANANGSSATLMPNTKGAFSPDWSRLDNRIVFIKGGGVYIQKIGTSTATRIATGRVRNLAVSPDGLKIAYQVQLSSTNADLFTMALNGSGKRNITRTSAISETQPAWRTNTVLSYARRTTKWAIYSMSAAGGSSIRITNLALNCQQPAYSPNGLRLACVTRVNAARNVIRYASYRGTTVRKFLIANTRPSSPDWASNKTIGYAGN